MSESPKQRDNEVCVRCLAIIREQGKAKSFFEHGRWWWYCTDEAWCKATQDVNRRNHRRTIDHRVLWLKPGEHLLVVQDYFGAQYGYGNLYIKVEAREDPKAIWAARKADDKDDALVLSETIGAQEK